jgi:hypothetical protein
MARDDRQTLVAGRRLRDRSRRSHHVASVARLRLILMLVLFPPE